MSIISERMKFAMKERGIKQIDIANDTGISKGALSCYISGLYSPKMDNIQQIAKSLNVDVRWLLGYNVPMKAVSPDDVKGDEDYTAYVYYNSTTVEYLLDDGSYDIYMGLMTQYAALIPRFYVIANSTYNCMHMLPIFLREDCSNFYKCPAEFFGSQHVIYTRDIETMGLCDTTLEIIYYGINVEDYKPEITNLSFRPQVDCFEILEKEFRMDVNKQFLKEIEKEVLYLKSISKL